MALRRALFATCLVSITLACGGGGEPTDLASLQQAFTDSEYATVEASAPAVLAAAKADGAPTSQLWQIEYLHLRAVAASGRGGAAATQIEKLAAAYPEQVDAQVYLRVIDEVADATGVENPVAEAIKVLKVGKDRYPEHDAFFAKKAESLNARGGDGVSDALAQLGYLGSDDEDPEVDG